MMLAEFAWFDMAAWSPAGQAVFRLILAAALGAITGAEREYHGRSAGLRTQLLVALGSCLAMLVSLHFATVYGNANDQPLLRVDPARVAYGIMSGIGFLGAGAIIRYGVGVRGLTTAASLWCTAAVGLACGFGMYLLAVVTTGAVLFALLVMSKLESFIPTRKYKTLQVTLPAALDNAEKLQAILAPHGVRVVDLELFRDNSAANERLTLHLSISSKVKKLNFLEWLTDMPGITQITIR